MQKINKLLTVAKAATSRKEHAQIKQVFARMTTDQLRELVYCAPSESRVHDILASVDGLHLLEGG